MKYILYKITNIVNNKIYVGTHKTNNVNDGYMVSGTNIKRVIKKYGIENFKKEIISFFDNENDMMDNESIVVNETFIKRNDVYNLMTGGKGGFTYINNNKLNMNFKNFGWKDKDKRRKVWESVPIDKRKEIGKYMGTNFGGSNRLTIEEINKRFELIKEIDLTKNGWVNKVSKVLNLSHTQVKRFMDKYYNGYYFRRKSDFC